MNTADWIQFGLLLVAAAVAAHGWLRSGKAQRLAEQANQHSLDANKLSNEANQISNASNQLAEKALKLTEEQYEVRLRVETAWVDRDEHGGAYLQLKVINDGFIDAELEDVGLARPSGKKILRPSLHDGFPMQLPSKCAASYRFYTVINQPKPLSHWLADYSTAVATTSCGKRFEIGTTAAIVRWIHWNLAEEKAENERQSLSAQKQA